MTRTSAYALAKTGIATALHWSGGARLLSAASGWQSAPPVITYHRVVADFAANASSTVPSMLVSARILEQQLDWIGRRFRFLSLDELGVQLESGGGFERRVAAITFDDGYRDFYEQAFPLLRRMGIPAAVFVVTDLMGTSRLQLHDHLYLVVARALAAEAPARRDFGHFLLSLGIRLPQVGPFNGAEGDAAGIARILQDHLPQADLLRISDALQARLGPDGVEIPTALLPLTWEMLAEMHRAGVTIGSHTRTHALLTNESAQKVLDETGGSKRELERRLGTTVRHFAYPAGRFDSGVVRAVAAAGYRFGYTICPHRDLEQPLLSVPRRVLWQNSGLNAFGRFSSTMMGCQVETALDFRGRCKQEHAAPRPAGGASDYERGSRPA